MKYASLDAEIRTRLEAHKIVGFRYSARIGHGDEFDATIMLTKGSGVEVDRLRGFFFEEGADALTRWFEHDTAHKDDNEAERTALHCLMDVEATFAEPRIKALEAANA